MQDLGLVIIGIVILAISVITVQIFLDAFGATSLGTQYSTIVGNAEAGLQVFNYGFIFIGVVLFIVVLVSSYYISTNPLFFGVAVILLGVFILIASVMSGMFTEFIGADSTVVAAANQFPLTIIFINNLPLITLGLGIVVGIVLYLRMGQDAYGS